MAKQAQEGGGDFLDSKELLALAEDDAVVLAFRVRRMSDFVSTIVNAKKPTVPQVQTHLLVLSPEERAGQLWLDQPLISGGITSKLVKENDNTAIGGRMETMKTGANEWAALNPPKARDWKLIEKVYDTFGLDPEADDADEKLFAVLRDRAGEPGEKVDLSAGNGNGKAKSTVLDRSAERSKAAKAADDSPPF
jgi:hypothetical protein